MQVLRHAVLSCELAPGAAFSEIEIEIRYRLGRAGIRAALQALAAEGLVVALPRQGWRTTAITGAFIGELLVARRRLEPVIAQVEMSAAERERLQTLVLFAAALAEAQDAQALVTARVTDRQILDLLAVRTDCFHRKWLGELWDHSHRVVSFFERGAVQYRSLGREGLLAALAASDPAGATEEILREIAHFEAFVTRALLRHPETLAGPVHERTARRSRSRTRAEGVRGEQPPAAKS